MIRPHNAGVLPDVAGSFGWIPDCCGSTETQNIKAGSASEKQVLPKPDLSVDEARMIVKDIPSVDIRATLGTWKLSEAELGQLRQWSGILVEKPGTTEFLAKWSELIRQAHARTPQIKEASITPLIRMVMLAAYEEAQKHQTASTTSAPSEVYKQLQEQLRANLIGSPAVAVADGFRAQGSSVWVAVVAAGSPKNPSQMRCRRTTQENGVQRSLGFSFL